MLLRSFYVTSPEIENITNMKRTVLSFVLASFCLFAASAAGIPVNSYRYAGPYPVARPYMVDSVNVRSEAFSLADILKSSLTRTGLKDASSVDAGYTVESPSDALNWIEFSFDNSGYATVTVKVDSVEHYEVYVDGVKGGNKRGLSPATHTVDIKFISEAGKAVSPVISLETDDESRIAFRTDGKHLYGMKDVLLNTRFSGVSLSADGKYMTVSYTTTAEGGKVSSATKLYEVAGGRMLAEMPYRMTWMPVSGKYYYTRRTSSGSELVTVDPATGAEEVLVEELPEGYFSMSPTEDFLIYSSRESGPEEKEEIYQILTPDDRQPGWRTRSSVAKFDIATGVMQPLTFGYHNSYISDISSDGRNALLMVSRERLAQRPTSIFSLYLLDLNTLETKTLVEDDGFLAGAQFSPDGSQVLLEGSPEAFGRIGMKVKEGQTPSMEDMQLYLYDLASGKISPLTRDFDPCVSSYEWNKADGRIYFTAENRDNISLYTINPKNGKIRRIDTPEDLVNKVAFASAAPVSAWYGQSASNSDRLYVLDLQSGKSSLREDLSSAILKDVELGECREWNFKNSKGETVYGRYYLPPHFDPAKKYPMIVNYYGGCSPTSRNFESRYPHHAYAALGYVVYVVAGPSGATGFGQEWSARHVNTAGDGPAQDIIEGSMQFCREHPFVNEKKVGCIGASYGGFMSEYLPTVTDFFACSVSHAGISGHTSYWGFGYWGYSYSEVSMAGSYPWSDQDLYVKQSPLYRADKINTPLLLIHGDADTNVPFNESVQLFTALKLLGKETALVAVSGENHHITDYRKRLEWQDTIWAWFAKWLQDDPSWWNALYPPKSL